MASGNPQLLEKIQRGQFLSVQPHLEPLQKILEELYNLIQSQQSKISKLENQINQKADNSVISDIQNFNNSLNDLQKSVSECNTRIDNNDNMIKDIQTSFAKNDKILEIEQKIQELEKDNENIHRTLKEHKQSISSHETLLESAKQIIDSLGTNVNNLSSDAKITKSMVNTNKQKISDLENKLQTLEMTHNSSINTLDYSINDMKINISDLFSKHEENRNRIDGLEDSMNQPTNVISREIPSELSNGDEKIESDNGKIKILERKIHNIELKLQSLENSLSSMQSRPIAPPTDQNQSIRNIHHSSDNKSTALPNLTSPDALAAVSQLRLEVMELKKRMLNDGDKYQEQFSTQQKSIDELNAQIQKLVADIINRPDKVYVERLFDKFKETLNNVIGMIQGSKNKPKTPNPKGYATHADIVRLEKMIQQTSYEFEETAAARKSSKCLCCGQSYRAISGGIQDPETLAVLGAAPIVHVAHDNQKPCFVYGTDHELYYSSSPRGRTFAQRSNSNRV